MHALALISLAGVLSWAALRKPRQIFYVAIFLAGWVGLSIDLGLRVTAFRLVVAVVATTLLLRFAVRGSPRLHSVLPAAFWVFLTYAVMRSVAQIPVLPGTEVTGGALRSPVMRSAFQAVVFVIEVSPVIIAPLVLRTAQHVWQAGRIYLVSAILLALLGWLQLAFWYGTGTNPLPIGIVDGLFGREFSLAEAPYLYEGAVSFGGLTLYRMSSLGGEPKQLGMSLSIALLLVQLIVSVPGARGRRGLWLAWLFLFVSMLLTLSTSALFLWILGSLALVTFSPWFHVSRAALARLARSVAVVLGLSALGMATTLALVPAAERGLGENVDVVGLTIARTVERGFREDFDVAVMRFLRDRPRHVWLGVGLGNVHLYANQYLPDYAVQYASHTAFVAKSGYLRLVSELGLVGLALFLWWTTAQVRRVRKIHHFKNLSRKTRESTSVGLIATLIALVCVLYLARGNYVVAQTFVAYGIAAAAEKNLRRRGERQLAPALAGGKTS